MLKQCIYNVIPNCYSVNSKLIYSPYIVLLLKVFLTKQFTYEIPLNALTTQERIGYRN